MDSRTKSIQDILGLMQKNLECSICLDLLTNPVSTKCDHPFCRFCITEFLKTKTSVPCPLCKCPITKRSLNDRPQLSNIVENVRRLMGAFSKDTGQKCSPPRASSSANPLSCTPEQLPRKEAKGTKRKISVSEKKGTSWKSNVRQSKRRKSDLTPEVMESTQDNTETDDINETNGGVETDQHVVNTALVHKIDKEKENPEESKSEQILSCLKSGAVGTLSEKADLLCTNPKALTIKGNTKPGDITLKGRTKSTSHLSGPEKDEILFISGKGDLSCTNHKDLTKGKKELGDMNLKSRAKRTKSTSHLSGPEGEELARTAENLNSVRHLRHQNKKNYKEDSEDIDHSNDEQVQGHSESQGHSELSSLPESTPHVATVTQTYDKQFVSRRNVRSVSKVKDWLTSNNVHGKVQGDSQESGEDLHGGSLEQLSNSGDNGFIEDEEEFELVSCDSSIPESILDKEHADTSDKNLGHSETASTSLPLSPDKVPPIIKSQTEKRGQVAHKIFKTTRNNKHLETSVKQTKGKFLFKKIQPKSVLGIDQGMGVKALKPKGRTVITENESFNLRELDLNTFGNDSDPYEFKSSQVTPIKPKVQRKKARDDKRKEGQISAEVQNVLSRKSGKSILKKANGDGLKEGMSGRGGEEVAEEKKKKKLSPKALQRQKDEEEALREMRDKISQAESYDLVTSTQEVIDHLTEEENGAEEEYEGSSRNKKIVSFNQDVIFISSQNQSRVKSLKGVSESPENRNTQSSNIGKQFTSEAGVRTCKSGGGNQETEKVFKDDCETGAHHNDEEVEMQDMSENLIGEISENVLTAKENKVGKLAVTSLEDDDNDDGNSSSTTDLDIQPGESEFAVPNLDIQPKEILEKLSSQDLIPNNVAIEKNKSSNFETEMEVDIVPNSEDLTKDTDVPKYKRKLGKEAMAKYPIGNKFKEGCKLDDDNVNLNKGDKQQRYTIQELEESSGLAVFGRGEELEGEGNCQKVDIKGGGADVNSVNVVPETPLIVIDNEASVTDAGSQPQEKKFIRKSRLKKSNKKKTCKKSPVATKNEESRKNEKGTVLSTNNASATDKKMSENIDPPSVDLFSTDGVILAHQSGKDGSGSISIHLSSETQDSQTSLGSKFKWSESTSTQQSSETQNSQSCTVRKLKNLKKKRGNRKAVPFVIQETPVLGEAKVTDEEVTELSREQQKQNTGIVTDSQQSMSSLCSTQESVSILAPVHKSFEKVVDIKSPASLKENHKALNRTKGQGKDIIEIKSQENGVDVQDKCLSCEIIPDGEERPIMITEINQSSKSSTNKLRRTKRKCFSLGSPEEVPKGKFQERSNPSKVDKEDNVKQDSSKKDVQIGTYEEDLEVVNDVEKNQRIPNIDPIEVKSSGDVKSTPSDALIPTQLSLRSIKKQEMKLKKQQQSSPEDVFLMDSEPLGSSSGYRDLVQNQEGLLELELGDLDGVSEMDMGESQVRSSSGRASGKVENSGDEDTDHVEKSSNVKDYRKEKVERVQCSGSGNDRRNAESESKNSETVTTIPDTEENEEEPLPKKRSRLRSARNVPSDSHVLQMDVKMRDKRDSLKNSDSQKNCSSSESDVSNAGKRAVRGLARKLRQKNLHDPHVMSEECKKVKMLDKDVCNGDPLNSSQDFINISESKGEKLEDQPMEAPVCFNVVPETVEVGLEDLEDQMDDEVTAIPETVEDSLLGEEEECDEDMETKREENEEEDTDVKITGIQKSNEDIVDQKTSRIQEKLKQDDSEKRNKKGLKRSLVSGKEDSLRMDDIQEDNKVEMDDNVEMDDVDSSPEQSRRQEDRNGGTLEESETVTKKGSYMETAADDEPLFHSPESSPLPDILEEEYEMKKERPSGGAIKSSKEAVPQKAEDSYDSDSSGFELLPEDIIRPEDMAPNNSPQNSVDCNIGKDSKDSVDFVQVLEGKVPSYERDAKSKRMGTHAKKRSEEDEMMKNFVDLSDDEDNSDSVDDDDELIHRRSKVKKKVVISDDDDDDDLTQRQTKKKVVISDDDDDDDELSQRQTKKKVVISDDDDDNGDEEMERIGRKKKKRTAVIISDDEEENDVTEDKKSKMSIVSNDEDDSDSSQESLVSRQMNLTSSSAFSSQSEGYNTQNQILLQQELERMKKEMAEIESRICKGNQTKSLKEQKSPSPGPSQETVEEPYSEYLRELQTEASEGDSPQQSQNTVSKMADDIKGCDSDDSSDLFLSPAPPSPPPNNPRSLPTAEVDLSENFKETEEFLKELRDEEKTSEGKFIIEENCEDRLLAEGEMKGRSENEAGDIIRSNQKSKNSAPGINSKRDDLTESKEPSVIQESPQSQKPGKTSMARLKDLYHSTPVSNIKKSQGGRKNTLSFLSPVLTPRELLGTSQTVAQTDTSVRVPSPAVQRSPGEDHHNKVFIASGLPLSQLNELRGLVQSHDCKFHPKFSPYTTHLIVKTVPPGSRMCERTLKFFQALAYKCWILDYQWVTDSVAAGRLLEEDPYEISGDTVTNEHHYGPRKSRSKSPTDPGILNGIQLHIIGSSQGLSSDDIRDLIETCGGSVIQEPEEFDRDRLCIIITCAALEDSQETAPSQEVILFNRLYRRYGAVTVSREWLLDSLTVYNLQPLSEYVLTSVKGMVIPSV